MIVTKKIGVSIDATELFCTIDDFIKELERKYDLNLLISRNKRKRGVKNEDFKLFPFYRFVSIKG